MRLGFVKKKCLAVPKIGFIRLASLLVGTLFWWHRSPIEVIKSVVSESVVSQ